MKVKVTILILLSIFIAPTMTVYLWLAHQKKGIKESVAEKISQKEIGENLVLLKFSKSESETKLKWEHASEFEYNQNMYDIVEIIEKKDSIFYWCHWDKEETEINQKIHALLANNQKSDPLNKASTALVDYFLKSLFINNVESFSVILPDYPKSIIPRFVGGMNSFCTAPPTPPPKFS